MHLLVVEKTAQLSRDEMGKPIPAILPSRSIFLAKVKKQNGHVLNARKRASPISSADTGCLCVTFGFSVESYEILVGVARKIFVDTFGSQESTKNLLLHVLYGFFVCTLYRNPRRAGAEPNPAFLTDRLSHVVLCSIVFVMLPSQPAKGHREHFHKRFLSAKSQYRDVVASTRRYVSSWFMVIVLWNCWSSVVCRSLETIPEVLEKRYFGLVHPATVCGRT